MGKNTSKRLVVDTNIARAMGNESSLNETSIKCRKFLYNVYEICHKVVFCPYLGKEWKTHKSNESKKWLVAMKGRKKFNKMDEIPTIVDKHLLSKLESNEIEIIEKDSMLIDLAFAYDKIIVSMDENARNAFHSLSKHQASLKNIIWVNPMNEDIDEIKNWLKKGTPSEPHRMLGYK